MKLAAWAFLEIGEDIRSASSFWLHVAQVRLMPAIFDDIEGRIHEGGGYFDPNSGQEGTYSGSPDLDAPSYLPGTHITYSAWVPGTGDESSAIVFNQSWRIEDDGYWELECSIWAGHLDTDDIGAELAGLLHEFCDNFSVLYASVAPDTTVGRTTLEEGLRRPKYGIAREQASCILRGYSWITVIPTNLQAHVIERLESKPDIIAEPLRSGVLFVRSGETFSDYTLSTAEDLFEALAPILPAGTPRLPRRTSSRPKRMVIAKDARSVAPCYRASHGSR